MYQRSRSNLVNIGIVTLALVASLFTAGAISVPDEADAAKFEVRYVNIKAAAHKTAGKGNVVNYYKRGQKLRVTGKSTPNYSQLKNGKWVWTGKLSVKKPKRIVRWTTKKGVTHKNAAPGKILTRFGKGQKVLMTGRTKGNYVRNAHGRWIIKSKLSASKPKTAPAVTKRKQVVKWAKQHRHDNYKYGGTGPNAWDCSGFVQQAWSAAGKNLPRMTGPQKTTKKTKKVAVKNIKPGDIVFYYKDVSHNGIYIGNGKVIHAANPQQGVTTNKLRAMPLNSVRRPK